MVLAGVSQAKCVNNGSQACPESLKGSIIPAMRKKRVRRCEDQPVRRVNLSQSSNQVGGIPPYCALRLVANSWSTDLQVVGQFETISHPRK